MKNLLSLLYIDFRRFIVSEKNHWLRVLFFTQGFSAILVYRIFHWVYQDLRIPILRPICMGGLFLAQKMIEVTTGIYLPHRCSIGRGFYISHFGGIILNPSTTIGDNCNLSNGVTIGIKWRGPYQGVPKIGNRVYIGPNAILIGGIEIGDDVAIGAGAVVTKSIPSRSVVVGNPSKIISTKGSFEYVEYDGMESDINRIVSLQQRDIPCS